MAFALGVVQPQPKVIPFVYNKPITNSWHVEIALDVKGPWFCAEQYRDYLLETNSDQTTSIVPTYREPHQEFFRIAQDQ